MGCEPGEAARNPKMAASSPLAVSADEATLPGNEAAKWIVRERRINSYLRSIERYVVAYVLRISPPSTSPVEGTAKPAKTPDLPPHGARWGTSMSTPYKLRRSLYKHFSSTHHL